MKFRWQRKEISPPVVYNACRINLQVGVDSYSPTGEHYIASCMTCDEFIDSDSSVPALAITEHVNTHKKRS